MNKKQRNLLLVLLGVFICCFGVMFLMFKKVKKEIIRDSTIGTVSAVDAALSSELKNGNPNLEEVFSAADEQWRSITVTEYDKTIRELDDKSYNLDAGPSRPLLDLWGNRLVIVYRKLPNSFYDSLVVSRGPDGIYGTRDDVVSSYDASPPSFDIEGPKDQQKR